MFDFDGLILDTEGPELRSWQETYESYGSHLPLHVWAVCIGGGQDHRLFDPYGYLEEQIGRPVDRDALRAQRRRRNVELLASEPIRPGVEGYLAAARRLDLRLGVASSSPRAWVVGHLERLGLLGRFDCVRCAEDVSRTKPEPELYLAALDGLGVAADEAVAFEDSPNGVLAAKRAGLYCVAVPNPVTAELDLSRADLRLEALTDLPLEDLLDRARLGAPGKHF